jgi:K+-transporting ATPase c subunit
MSSAGEAISAALYVASNAFSWSEARKMPGLQAAANKEVLNLQKAHYDAVSAEQRSILNASINEYLNSVDALLNGFDYENAFPETPEAAEYVPVDACCLQGSTIECNISHTDKADAYVRYVNRLHEQNDFLHAISGNPTFMVDLHIQSRSVQDLMRGRLPVGDVVEVLGDNAEMASLTGRIGNTRKTTLRDLGISKLRAQAAGRKEFREVTVWFNSAVSPMQRQGDIRDSMQKPQERIALALQQAQLIQNSLQNRNNALAQKDPYLLAKLQTRIQADITRLQQKANEALLTNTHVPNFAATIFPKLSNVSQLVGGIGQAVGRANLSHFLGHPSQSQDGYPGQSTGSSGYAPTNNNWSDGDWG